MKKFAVSLALLTSAALALAGCGTPPEGEDTPGADKVDFLACMISDAGGFDDKSFNQSGYEGMTRAEKDLGVSIKEAESKDANDFGPNLDSMKTQKCDLTITVGFMLKDATEQQALANEDMKFAIVDDSQITLPNVKPLVFKTSDAAFLAGYAAAAYSTTGKVATFGGMKIPSVTIFMDGFADGVAQYNTDTGKKVEVLGWNKEAQNGMFTETFDNQATGKQTAQTLIDQGADVIMPVAGPVGLGAAAAAQEANNVVIIGVDADWFETAPQYQDIVLTSVIKEIGTSVFDTIKESVDGNYSSTPYVGTLANGGVALAPFHNFDSQLDQATKDRIAELTEMISNGTYVVSSPSDPQ
ncbi:MAG: BMP family ABC transporter substrate-binding protein [Propionibacteriaceae bacterium]|nr:BMP family ABC transporter substrate-binding protein [Propionibacteriaceae bacterium]